MDLGAISTVANDRLTIGQLPRDDSNIDALSPSNCAHGWRYTARVSRRVVVPDACNLRRVYLREAAVSRGTKAVANMRDVPG